MNLCYNDLTMGRVFSRLRWVVVLAVLSGCSTGVASYRPAPSVLPRTERAMKAPGFWVSLQPHPDRVLMDPLAIKEFNQRVVKELGLVSDLSAIPDPYVGAELSAQLEKPLTEIRKKNLYQSDGQRPHPAFWERLRENLNLAAIPSVIELRYGLIVHYADQRIFPTAEVLTAKPRDIDFDELQNNTFDVGTPVVILHESADREWCYVLAELSSGWIKKEFIAVSDRGDWEQFLKPDKSVTVTEAKADIFLDPEMTRYYDYARMGTPFGGATDRGTEAVRVLLPGRDAQGKYVRQAGYLRVGDVSDRDLPFTPRHVLEQAFKLLNAPYGWGGMYGEQDCSAFLIEIFSTFGIRLPRNSGDQAKVGRILEEFSDETSEPHKAELLAREAVGGATLLPMKGHIMLYLGDVDGRPYAIHDTWGYRERNGWLRVINRVAVTDLSLGENSKKGSLLKRLKSVNVLSP